MQTIPNQLKPAQQTITKGNSNLERLFNSILDGERGQFNLSALPAGITIIDCASTFDDIVIMYQAKPYHILINNHASFVEELPFKH